jgi:hypothetical protein
MLGQKRWQDQVLPHFDHWSQHIILTDLPTGIYFLQVEGTDLYDRITLIKK